VIATNSYQWSTSDSVSDQIRAGFRFGARGTHSSRTMMLAELSDLLIAIPRDAPRADYATAIIDDNALGKQTASTRRLTNQRLGELYGLDPRIPMFRVLRRLWDLDQTGRPLLALLTAIARDPLLRATVPAVVDLVAGQELGRAALTSAIRVQAEHRLNDSVLDKVARNAASSWTQSGHLKGRLQKIRQRVPSTPAAAAFALWLGQLQGLVGDSLLQSGWSRVLDQSQAGVLELALRAKQLQLIHVRAGGSVVEIDATDLDPGEEEG
jgi:hypothetical protein